MVVMWVILKAHKLGLVSDYVFHWHLMGFLLGLVWVIWLEMMWLDRGYNILWDLW